MQLTEWRPSRSMPLDPAVRRVLEQTFKATLSAGTGPDEYVVRPGGVVGSVAVGAEMVTVRPKIDIDRVLFMVAFANDPYRWQDQLSSIGTVSSLVDGMAALFTRACEPLVGRGLLRDYRAVDVDDRVVRGKVRWGVQSRRFVPVPVALRHDVHDDDIAENRVLRAACQVLRQGDLSRTVSRDVAQLWNVLRELSPMPRPTDAADRLVWTRRNLHYRPAMELAGVVLRGDMADVVSGDVPVTGFTLLMHDVFERFVRVALRTHWGASDSEVPDSWSGKHLVLDRDGEVVLEPDIGWRADGAWRFVGDAKYKKDDTGSGQSADIYQSLAYAVGTGLPEATLFYAEGGEDRDLVLPAVGRIVRVRHLDLTATPSAVLRQATRAVQDVTV